MPLPERPTKAKTLPGAMVRFRSLSARILGREGYEYVTFLKLTCTETVITERILWKLPDS